MSTKNLPYGWPERLDSEQSNQMLVFALAGHLRSRIPSSTLQSELIEFYGLQPGQAQQFIGLAKGALAHATRPTRAHGRRKALSGGGLVAFGLVLTLLSYANAISAGGSGRYLV